MGRLRILLIVGALFVAQFCTAATEDMRPEEIAEQAEPAVVVVKGCRAHPGRTVQGSGVCVGRKGLVLTAAHLVGEDLSFEAVFQDGAACRLELEALDKQQDMALFRTEVPSCAAVRIGDAALLANGAPLVAITAPRELAMTVVTGVVSNRKRAHKGIHVIQTDLPFSPGSSGGPVFDRTGALIGIVLGKLDNVEGATLLNPVNNAYPLLAAHGVALSNRKPAQVSGILEHIAFGTAQHLARSAVEAYNRGVEAESVEDSVRFYRQAVELAPQFFEAWFNLGIVYSRKGTLDKAAHAYTRAERLQPGAVAVQRNLGRVFYRQGRMEEALVHFLKARSLAPADATSYNDVGETQRRLGRYNEAEASFIEALRLDPAYAKARYNLALACAAKNRYAEAAAHLKDYLRLAPAAPDAEEVHEWIVEFEHRNEQRSRQNSRVRVPNSP
jgi:Tfp pilus assembly protein PilF